MPNVTPLYHLILNKPVDVRGSDAMAFLTKESYLDNQPLDNSFSLTDLFPIYSDDKQVEGLSLYSNDSTLKSLLQQAETEYEIVISKAIDPTSERLLQRGMLIDDLFFSGFHIIKKLNKGKRSVITVRTHDEATHLVTMLTQLGYSPVSIKRTRVNSLRLGILPTGRWRFIKKNDMLNL